jgi:predicted AAA+ superfamily ATPase
MQHIIERPGLIKKILVCLKEAPVTMLLGARQVGKTTLARLVAEQYKEVTVFDIERPADREAMSTTPELVLGACRGLVVIDEVQRLPELFTILRPLSDRPEKPAVFMLLGSASPELVKGASESLAGRVLFVGVPGFSLAEIGNDHQELLWFRGGFPRACLSPREDAWRRWMDSFVTTFLERDVPQLGLRVPAPALRRFWTILAHYHGQIWNASEVARAMDVSPVTARHYLDILCGLFLVRALPPWHENLKKRQVKSPKVYLRDSGLLHFLLGVESMAQLRLHPRRGASWEGFALEQVLMRFGERNAYFWATQRGAELDLLLLRGEKRFGFEFKCADAPGMTRSMHVALEDLKLDALYVIYPGLRRYRLHTKAEALPLSHLHHIQAFSY